MQGKEILISEGNRPWWQTIIAALFFTGMIVLLYIFITTFNTESDKTFKRSPSYLEIAIFFFVGGVNFSIVRDYHFNFEEKKYKILFCIGPVKI